MSEGPDRISFLGGGCPRDFRVRTLTLPPGTAVDWPAGCAPADWADALVVVERGELEVECGGGTRGRFAAGAVLSFAGLPLRRLRNAGTGPLVLSALSRALPPDR